jgi:hypothetical protein
MINTEIYGTPDQWVNPFSTQEHEDRNLMFLQAYFGGGGVELQDGYGYGVSINTPLDKSLSWCGLGTESTWSHIEYYQRTTDFPLIAKDNRTITNFSWNYTNGYAPGLRLFNPSTVASQQYGDRQRFAPLATNSESYKNYNNGVQPYTQIPVKNCVLVPFFRVAETIPDTATTSGMNIQNVVAWQYYSDTPNITTHLTHPYILGIGFRPYYYSSDISSSRTGHAPDYHRCFSILDPISLQKGLPRTKTDPSLGTMGEVYVYNIFDGNTGRVQMLIFGHINNQYNDTEYLQYYNTDTDDSYGTAILPHPNAVYSEEMSISFMSKAKWYYLEYYDGLKEWVRRQLACFGLFFTDDKDTAETGEYDSENMLLGVLVDGVGHGDYTNGEANRSQPQWQWDTTNDSDYDPSNPPEIDDNIYGRPWGFNPVSLADSTVRRYVMDDNALQAFGSNLWDIIDTTDPDELIQNQTLTNFLTNNPLDCVISLKRFPFADMSTASAVNIVLGKVRVSAAGKPFAADSTIKSCGIKHVYRRFKDFQWQNYLCEYFLYLPFCGTLQLDAETVIGRDLKVYYAIDYTTGTCTAFVTTFDDDGAECYLDSASGNLAIDVALTGVETATLTGQIYNANENLKLTKFNQALGYVKSGMDVAGSASKVKYNPTGLFNSALDLGQDIANNVVSNKNAEWNINNTQIPLKMIGASSGCNAFQGELRPCLIVHYPITVSGFNKDAYLHTVGAACCESGLIGSYSGYLEVSNVDLSGFRATATEKNMILSALSAGVYL